MKRSLRLLHFADLHLGIENYGRLDPGTGLHTRVLDFVGTLGRVFDLALEREVDLVLFAGDAYKNCDPTPTHQREFARQLHRLQQDGIPIVIVVGNHDTPVAFGKATSVDIFSALELDAIHVIRRPQLLHLETRSGPVQVAGLPWPTRNILRTYEQYKDLPQEDLLEKIQEICSLRIAEFARQLDPDLPAVLTTHIAAAEATYSGSERTAIIGQDPTLLTSVLADPAFDYVALGHVHKHQDLHAGQRPPVVYAGSLERIDFGEEEDEKGVCLVTIAENPAAPSGRTATCEFVPTAARRFVTIQLEVLEEEDPTQAIVDAIAETDIDDAVIRILYTLHSELSSPVDLARVHQALASAFYVAGILPQTAPSARPRRAGISEEMGLQEALDRYLENNPALQEHRDTLQRYARDLENELDSSPMDAGDE